MKTSSSSSAYALFVLFFSVDVNASGLEECARGGKDDCASNEEAERGDDAAEHEVGVTMLQSKIPASGYANNHEADPQLLVQAVNSQGVEHKSTVQTQASHASVDTNRKLSSSPLTSNHWSFPERPRQLALMTIDRVRSRISASGVGIGFVTLFVIIGTCMCVFELSNHRRLAVNGRSTGRAPPGPPNQHSYSKPFQPVPSQKNGIITAPPTRASLPPPASKPQTQVSLPGSSSPSLPMPHQFSLAVPSLLEASLSDLEKSDFKINDLGGKTLLNVTVMVPPKGIMETDGTPLEYLTIYSRDGEDELAMCALGPQGPGMAWRCDVYQKGDSIFGHIVVERKTMDQESYSLITASKERLLSIVTDCGSIARTRRTSVYGRSGNKCAELFPGSFSFLGKEQYYQVDCWPEADVGIVVISLMAVDRMRTHAQSQHGRWL